MSLYKISITNSTRKNPPSGAVSSDPSSAGSGTASDSAFEGVLAAGSGAVSDPAREGILTAQNDPFFRPAWYTSEITQPPPPSSLIFQAFNKKITKLALQSVARHILRSGRVAKHLQKLVSRVSTCYRSAIAQEVPIWMRRESGDAYFANLATCASVWACPYCASKISERRRVELMIALAEAEKQGLKVYLFTLTLRHHKGESLNDLLEGMSKARRLMRNRKPWKAWAAAVGLVGSVRSLEVTNGINAPVDNGWHVHTHEILFCRDGEPLLASDVLPMWQRACETADLQIPDFHGVDITSANDAVGDYVSKWGFDHELTKSMIKKGKANHLTPWDLLRHYQTTGDEVYADLFREYVKCFYQKRQLVWSDGLRDLLELGKEKTEQELADEKEKDDWLLGKLTLAEWRVVIKHDKRGEVEVVAKCTQDIYQVKDYIKSLEEVGG